MPQSTRKPRQSADQWQSVVDQHASSGLSALQFCTLNDITYQSFMRWRKKLELVPDHTRAPDSTPDFVELTAPGSMQPPVNTDPLWHIELDLAPGVQLRISR